MLSESSGLRAKRRRLLVEALERGELPSFTSVVTGDHAVHGRDSSLSYSVSVSLVSHLEAIGGRERLLNFVDRALVDGSRPALAESYPQLGDLSGWERHWLESLRRLEPVPVMIP